MKTSKFLSILLVLFALTGCNQQPTESQKAQQTNPNQSLYYNGDIITMEGDIPAYAEAVVCENGIISFVGNLNEAEKLFPQAQKENLDGATLLPGFIDGHGHISGVGLQGAIANLLPAPDGPGNSVSDIVAELKKWQTENPEFIENIGWILGIGYDDAFLEKYPSKEDLDLVSTNIPVAIIHQSGHLSVLNSKALEIADITAETKNPEAGTIRRKEGSNEPNGVLETAAHFNFLYGLIMPLFDLESELSNLRMGQEIYVSYGYTTAQDGRSSAGNTTAFQAAADRGELKIDVVAYPDLQTNEQAMSEKAVALEYTNHYRIGGVKVVLDGSPQGKTAWLTQCYHVNPQGQEGCYKGHESFPDANLYSQFEKAYKNDWQIHAHANGDAAIEQMIRVIAQANDTFGLADRRPVAIHAQTARFDQLDRMKAEGIMPSFFPMHTYYWGDWHVNSVLGEERAFRISPCKTALDKGILFTSHHDAPVTFPNSLRVLDATVNRTSRTGVVIGPEERVSPYVALKSMTDWAAYQHFEEDHKGTLTVGKMADFVILDSNPLKIEPADLHQIQVMKTIKEGKTVYSQ